MELRRVACDSGFGMGAPRRTLRVREVEDEVRGANEHKTCLRNASSLQRFTLLKFNVLLIADV
jgi:hypothetical protein